MTDDGARGDRMNRAEHLAWARNRALEYVDAGDNANALASLTSDLRKHPDTAPSSDGVGQLGMQLMLTGSLRDAASMREFIEGVA